MEVHHEKSNRIFIENQIYHHACDPVCFRLLRDQWDHQRGKHNGDHQHGHYFLLCEKFRRR